MDRGASPKHIVLNSALKPVSSSVSKAGKVGGATVRHEFQRLKSRSRLPPTSLFLSMIRSSEVSAKSRSVYYRTIFFNVDRADQLDCRRWRDNIKKAVRNTLRGG